MVEALLATNPAIDNLCLNLSTSPESVVLTSPNVGVVGVYDVLYDFHPLTEAVYTEADSGRGCILEVGLTSSSTDRNHIPSLNQTLFRRWSLIVSYPKDSRHAEQQVIVTILITFHNL